MAEIMEKRRGESRKGRERKGKRNNDGKGLGGMEGGDVTVGENFEYVCAWLIIGRAPNVDDC